MIKRDQFSHPNPKIINPQVIIPRIGTKGTHGVLNGLGSSGLDLRITMIPAHTRTKANKVPILVISPATWPGINAANAPTKARNSQFDL